VGERDTKLARCFLNKNIKPPSESVLFCLQPINKVTSPLLSCCCYTLQCTHIDNEEEEGLLLCVPKENPSRTQSRLQTSGRVAIEFLVFIEMPVYYFKSQLVASFFFSLSMLNARDIYATSAV
jgi:hypothetical protein